MAYIVVKTDPDFMRNETEFGPFDDEAEAIAYIAVFACLDTWDAETMMGTDEDGADWMVVPAV